MAHLVLEDLPRAAVDCARFTLLSTEGTLPSLCSVSAFSLELSAVSEVHTHVMYVRTFVHCTVRWVRRMISMQKHHPMSRSIAGGSACQPELIHVCACA